ncbi:DUF3147 family protein [Reinekea marina]|uniref:DUF3147 family protein n=2 Tax=Reinekea marina TaxID=1310421 RepID=A0ABV7WUV1_9GAMM
MFILYKYLITAALVVLISEVAKRSANLGALIASLPIVTLLVLIWLHVEGAAADKITKHAFYTFWYVIPTLPMFLVFPLAYRKFGFWLSLVFVCILTVVLVALWSKLVSYFGIKLF